jgi:hypothetical protein
MLCLLADPFPVEEMYRMDVNGKWCPIRGTSQIENVNRRYNNVLNGANNSAQLAQALHQIFFGRLNMDASAKCGGSTHYGSYQLHTLTHVNHVCKELGLQILYPSIPSIDMEEPLSEFGHEWCKTSASGRSQPDGLPEVKELPYAPSCGKHGSSPGLVGDTYKMQLLLSSYGAYVTATPMTPHPASTLCPP